MPLPMLSVMGLVTVAVLNVIPGRQLSNFPLSDCSSREMDILALLYDSGDVDVNNYQRESSSNFVKHVSGSSNNVTSPRVLYAEVYDMFSVHNPNVKVSDWHFLSCDGFPIYGNESIPGSNSPYTTLQENLEIKVTFVEHLFSEMSGVRKNATHIAVIFLDGARYSQINTSNLIHIVEQRSTAMKIFVVVIGRNHENQTIYLGDALLVPNYIHETSTRFLSMALCHQCNEGWFSFNPNEIFEPFSCYTFLNQSHASNWFETMEGCYKKGGYLATIESDEEFYFLKTRMFSYVKYKATLFNDLSFFYKYGAQFYIGLIRNKTSVPKRFQWSLRFPTRSHPFLKQKYWMSKRPASWYDTDCGAWVFSWDHPYIFTGTFKNWFYESGFADVSCMTRLTTLGVCEITLLGRLEEMNKITISPSSKEHFSKAVNKTQPAKVGDNIVFDSQIMIFGDNIVSVSANIASTGFLKVLKETGREFPIFDCGEDEGYHRHISYVYVCDYIDNCINKRDEMYCSRDSVITQVECSGAYCCDGSCLLVEYINDNEMDCVLCKNDAYIDDELYIFNIYMQSDKTCAFMCNDGSTCIEFSKLNDGITDCRGSEGPLDETIGKLKTANTCSNYLGHETWAPSCVYVLDRYGAVMGCRDMSHLNGCTNFTCTEGYVKCPKTYCIPQHYVLDGKADCPTGEDEYNYNVYSCTGNFACWNSDVCLHPDQVCDGCTDCPHGDDEVDCNVNCADGFHCISGTVSVSDYNRSIPLINDQLINANTRYIDLSGVDISLMGQLLLDGKKNVQFINWSNCKIRNLFRMFSLTSSRIVRLDISYNLIQTFSGSDITFHALDNIRHLNLSYNRELVIVKYLQFKFLETLDLSNTGISYLDESFMIGLPVMKHLNMSYTYISHVHKYVFSSNITLQTLDFRGIHFDTFYTDLFNGLIISQHLYADNFEMCCPQIRGANIPSYTCHTKDDAMSSCFDLVGSNVQRVLLWVVAVLAVLGNITVIAYRVWWDKSVIRTGYRLFVTNLGVSDCIMGLYLFMIAGADYYYRGTYALYSKIWRGSIECRLASLFATISLETSTHLCFFITLDRFLVMKFPFGQKTFSKSHQTFAVLLSWVMGFILALAPIVFNLKTYSSSAMCLDMPLTKYRLKGWEYSFGVSIVHPCVMFIFIAYGQISIFRAMSQNRITNSASSTSSHRPEDILVAKQLFLVALSNFLCWFPIGITGLMSLGENNINSDVYAWITIVVLPINSAANPLLYTIPALMAKWN